MNTLSCVAAQSLLAVQGFFQIPILLQSMLWWVSCFSSSEPCKDSVLPFGWDHRAFTVGTDQGTSGDAELEFCRFLHLLSSTAGHGEMQESSLIRGKGSANSLKGCKCLRKLKQSMFVCKKPRDSNWDTQSCSACC